MDLGLMTYLRRTLSSLLMLLTFITYVGNVSLFSHRHTIDGQTVVHSHIYSGDGEQPDHSHSSQQFKTIEALAMYTALATTSLQHIAAPLQYATTLIQSCTYNIVHQSILHFSLRAPPAIM
ncbi:MAG: hypothetical protein J6R84_05525 [Alistipes sp.]|nr:hypothetical protein [Alistipes sp.]MBO5984191.1 hypothetical protein [Rikenellaceae bacterium]